MPHPRIFWFALIALACGCDHAFAAELEPVDPRQFYLQPGEQAQLDLHASDDLQGSTLRYTISDYDGHTVTSASAAVGAGGKVEIPLKLPRGYYEIAFASPTKTFGLMALERYAGEPDPFFCMDAALSWLVPRDDNRRRYVDLLKRCGFAMARERLGWPAINPKPDQWDWETARRYDSVRKLYHDAGIPVLELDHELPAWSQPLKGDRFPGNLLLANQAWKEIANRWASTWGGLEIWNEPDTYPLPADLYVPMVKALHYEYEKAKISVPLGGGVFAYFGKPYQDLAAENGLLDEVDFISFHFYDDALALDNHIATFRAWLKQFGEESKPLWLTENGKAWDGVPGQPATLSQDQARALDFAASGTEARACGVARYFPFILVPYSEKGRRNFGMTGGTEAPYRTLAAYAAAARILGHKSYLGTLSLPGIARARVFGDGGGDVTAVLYAGPGSSSPRVKLPFTPGSICGIDGRALAPGDDGEVSISDGLVYVTAPRAAVAGMLDTGGDATRLYQIAQEPSLRLPASPIVLQPLPNLSALQPSGRGYQLAEGTTQINLTVRVNNFSGQPHQVELQYHPWGSTVPLQTKTAAVPAAGSVDLPATVPLASLPPNPSGVCVLEITATAADIARIGPVALNLVPSFGLEEYLKNCAYKFTAPIGELNRWKKDANGAMTMETTPEDPWSMSVTFRNGDRWAYPQYTFPQEVDLDRVQGVLVRARCAQPATVRLMAWTKSGKEFHTGYSIIPADGAWHVAYVPIDALMKTMAGQDPEHPASNLAKVSVGLNSAAPTNRLDISDLYFLGKS